MLVDGTDARGRKLVAAGGELDRSLCALWRGLASEVAPTTVIDVGANFGEVAFAATYPADCEVHLVEPNPAVARWLDQTIGESALTQVYLHVCAAGDTSGRAWLELSGWSGQSRLATEEPGTGVSVPVVALDDLRLSRLQRVLMKIDVEGDERRVLEGARETIAAAETIAIVAEVVHLSDEDSAWIDRYFTAEAVREFTLERSPVSVGDFRRTPTPGFLKDVVLHPRVESREDVG